VEGKSSYINDGEGGAGGASSHASVGSVSSGMSSSNAVTSGMSSSGSVSSSSSSSSSGEGGGGGMPNPVDCANIPKGPFSYKVKYGQKASEDMDFDNAGYLVGAEGSNIFRSTFNGISQIWVPGAGNFIAGLRFTSNGVLVYASVNDNALFRIDPPANKQFVVGGLSYPNGMDADNKGRITVAEQSASQLRRVDPMTGEFEILATGLNAPNGVSYSPDYKTVYVGSFGGGVIYKVPLDAQDKPMPHSILAQGFADGGSFDGMGVDACGNVYVCEYVAAKVWRVSPDGMSSELVVNLSGETGWIPNMQWGSGVGGWDPMVLYVRDISSEKMYEVPVGVPQKPRKYP
jgi:streptogramin lyase